MKYAGIIKKGNKIYGAYVPDLPGCVALGKTPEEVKTLIKEAIEFHLESLQEDGEEIPLPNSYIEYIEAKISA